VVAQGVAGTMRTWLVKGTRRFAVDPRRRFGRNGGARRLLSADEAAENPHGAWGGLVSALQRHTVHGELAQLSRGDRQILSLAYLSGHTNREIATILNVSVSTVRRRLSIALARLEESMRRAGMWVSVIALAALGLYTRVAHSARTTRWPASVAVLAAGTATAVTLGVVTVGPAAPRVSAGSQQNHVRQPGLIALGIGSFSNLDTVSITDTIVSDGSPDQLGTAGEQDSTGGASPYGCHGNPTNAPPSTPVRSHGDGSPVTHPGKGGCGPHAS
jgi:DNA-binding CsgD family transcriptional regulator